MIELAMTLAQATQPAAPAPGADPFMRTIFPILIIIAIFYFVMIRGNRKDQRRFADMLANLKRNDRVQTIGGILGTVVDVRGDEVILKVDEASNVKMRFVRSAIKQVFADTAPAADKDKEKK